MRKPGEFRAFAILLVLLLACIEALLAYNTLYTEGEVMQGLYHLLVWANLPILITAIWKPRIGSWCAVTLGAALLPWQAAQNRKWAQIHEEIISIIRHVDSRKDSEGAYPPTLDDYNFGKPWVREHVSYGVADGTYRISYFMNDPGTSYWYNKDGGFGYYPD